jgi:hypothetical protein
MTPGEAAQRLGDLLEDDGLAYAVGGALALGVWGAPRLTKDVDISVFASAAELDRVCDALERAGMIFDRVQAQKDVARIGLFKGRLGGITIDVFISTHPHFSEMHRRRQRVDAPDGTHLYFISAEDLCVMRLVYGRDKDRVDLERLFAVRLLDTAYIRSWIAPMLVARDRAAWVDDLEQRFPRR